MKHIFSWGRLNHYPHQIHNLNNRENIFEIISSQTPGIAHGNGRSYGDVCLNPNGILWYTTALNRLIDFDPRTGRLRCEAGVLLRDIQSLMVPRGWMLPVTPGTQLITIGGAIANDVHGKNHHVQGSFGNHVRWIKLLRTNGEIIECTPDKNADWFAATVGGIGLTGVMSEMEIQLRPVEGPWLESETIPYENLNTFFQLADSSEKDWEYTVSWIDCLSKQGRGLFMRANHTALAGKSHKNKQLKIPFTPPVSLINRLSLRLFNSTYFYLKKKQAQEKTIVHYEPFFYPLDNLLEWNRLYGPKGFFQYQSVVPHEVGQDATQAMLDEISKSGEGSFLAVLKTFGNRESLGMMSFPQPGVTLALDFPNKGERTLKLFERLDAIVREAKGRIYLAKDARMSKDLFETGYPGLAEFLKYRDPGIISALSKRLIGS